MKKPLRELGRAHGAPIPWRVVYERDDGSTVSCVVEAQTFFAAREKGATQLGKLPSECRASPLNDPAPK